MGLFARLAGSMSAFFQFGGPAAPGINHNGVALEVRDSTNSVFAVLRGASPSAANDFATKAYVDAATPPGGTETIAFALGVATASSVAIIPNGATVLDARLNVTTPYSGGATIEIGQVGALASFQATTDNDPQVDGLYQAEQVTSALNLAVTATVLGAPVAGVAEVVVTYTVPLA
jgi:hypothetical protein